MQEPQPGEYPSPGGAVRQLAEKRLRENPYRALRGLSCEYPAGVLVLQSRLPSYYLTQVAQAAVAGIEGVQRIANENEVARSQRRDGA